tara:strand:+ start:533 stop:916 length:384 start_codon:yes stop_codon:yes gene_type:complete
MSIDEIRKNYFWFVNGNRIGIVEKNKTLDGGDEFLSVQKAGMNIRIEYITRPLPFTTDLTESSELPDQFHEAICYKVISDLYKLPGETLNLQLAQYFDQQYLLQVREGKKVGARNKVSSGVIKPWSY